MNIIINNTYYYYESAFPNCMVDVMDINLQYDHVIWWVE